MKWQTIITHKNNMTKVDPAGDKQNIDPAGDKKDKYY